MPNWITNKITAPKHVIEAVINDKGHVDFSLMAPFPGPRGAEWDGIYGDAETAAEKVLGIALDNHPLLGFNPNAGTWWASDEYLKAIQPLQDFAEKRFAELQKREIWNAAEKAALDVLKKGVAP